MSIKKKAWFFETPRTTAYKRFSQYNRPSEATLKNFSDSVAMKLEVDDTASETQQGLVKLATNANVISRTSASAGQMMTAVQPHQLPLLVGVVNSVETVADTIATAVEGYDGIKITPIYNGDSTAMNMKIEFDATIINNGVEGTPDFDADKAFAVADKFIFYDYSESKLKTCNASALVDSISGGYWDRDDPTTTISPATANDNLDLGTGSINTAGVTLDGATNRTIEMEDGTGPFPSYAPRLTVKGGDNSSDNGGDLILKGGASSIASDGGDVHIYGGGTSGGTEGNVLLGYSEGGSGVGYIGVGGAIDSSYLMKVHGDVKIDGDINATLSKTTAPTAALGITAANDIVKNTAIQTKDFLFGSGSKGDILVHDGTEFSRIADPGAAGYIKTDGAGNISWDTTLTNSDKYVAVDASATPGYLYNGGAGVLRLLTNKGLTITDSGDYISLGIDPSDLNEVSIDEDNAGSELSSSVIVTGENTKGLRGVEGFNLSYYVAGMGDSGWLELNADDEYYDTPTTASRIATYVSFLKKLKPGMPVKYKLSAGATKYWGIITDVTATYIDIAGPPLTTGDGDLDKLWVGHPSKVISKELVVNIATYNSATSTGVLEDKMNISEGFKWLNKDAHCVYFSVIHGSDDSTTQPLVNIRCGDPGDTGDYISTSNTNKGLLAGTTLNETVVDIDPSYYDIEFGQNIEVKVDKNGGTGDADYLTVFALFVAD